MAYGLRIKDASAVTLLLSSDIGHIISSGKLTMSSSLEADNTYGEDVDLPGTDAYDEDMIGVICYSFRANINLYMLNTNISNGYYDSFFMDTSYSFYTRNTSTGVMTSWTPGSATINDRDSVLAAYPIAFWDKMGASTFTSVRIFAATEYLVYDQSASSWILVYSIGSQGVEKADYAVYIRNNKGV